MGLWRSLVVGHTHLFVVSHNSRNIPCYVLAFAAACQKHHSTLVHSEKKYVTTHAKNLFKFVTHGLTKNQKPLLASFLGIRDDESPFVHHSLFVEKLAQSICRKILWPRDSRSSRILLRCRK